MLAPTRVGGLTWPAAALASSLVLGGLAATRPLIAAGLVAVALIAALAFLAPVAHLVTLIVSTAIVPLEIQNRFSIGGGLDSPGLLVSDALLATGLARAGLVLLQRPLDRRERLAGTLALAILGLAALQMLHGLAVGREASEAAAECRVIAQLAGVLLIAMPVLADPAARGRLIKSLVVAGLALGAWGIVQVLAGLRFADADDATAARGATHLTGGLIVGQYAFPVASVMALAGWTSAQVRSLAGRGLLLAVLSVNVIAMVINFERTFWVAAVIGFAFLAVKARPIQRMRIMVATPAALVLVFLGMLTLTPAVVDAARERLLSIGEYQDDPSVRYRIAESRKVLEQIREQPVAGSGFGATIHIGRPGTSVEPKPRRYAENGYLWLAWKMGIPAALIVLALLAVAIAWRTPFGEEPRMTALRNGAQAGLLALVVSSVTFPSFNQLAITPTMGLLLAIAAAPPRRQAGPRRGSSA